jgi:hypothetical protein
MFVLEAWETCSRRGYRRAPRHRCRSKAAVSSRSRDPRVRANHSPADAGQPHPGERRARSLQNRAEPAQRTSSEYRSRKVGAVLRRSTSFLSPAGNIIVPMVFNGRTGTSHEEQAMSLLQRVDLSPRANHLPREPRWASSSAWPSPERWRTTRSHPGRRADRQSGSDPFARSSRSRTERKTDHGRHGDAARPRPRGHHVHLSDGKPRIGADGPWFSISMKVTNP